MQSISNAIDGAIENYRNGLINLGELTYQLNQIEHTSAACKAIDKTDMAGLEYIETFLKERKLLVDPLAE